MGSLTTLRRSPSGWASRSPYLGFPAFIMGSRKPVISDVAVSNLSDVSFELTAMIRTKGETSVMLHYGLTTALEAEPIEFFGSPIFDDIPTEVVITATPLLPYKRYFFKIVATNPKGSTEYSGNVITMVPQELNDDNWVAMYDANYEKNVMHATNTTQLVELRDKQYDCELGDDLFANTEFDSASGWTLGLEMSIADGKLQFTGSTASSSAYIPIVGGADVNPCHIEAKGVIITAGAARARVSYGINYVAGVATAGLSAGDSEFDVAFTNAIAYVYVVNLTPYPTTISIDSLRIRKIKGRHLINVDSVRPTKSPSDDFITISGTQRIIGYSIPAMGSVYALVKRTGIDGDFTLRNNLDSIGQYSGTTFTLGANAALSTFYPMQIKRLAMRKVTDSAGTIAKLNEWFSRDSYEIPPISNGVLSNGIWNDSAIWNDNEIPVTV